MKTINIACNSTTDYILLLREITNENRGIKDLTLEFEKGTYTFKDKKAIEDFNLLMSNKLDYDTHWGKGKIGYNKAIVFENIENLNIIGHDSSFIFSGLISPFTFIECKNTTIENISINWERAPFSIGSVVSINNETIKVKGHKDFPIQGGEPIWALMDYDPNKKRFGEVWKFRNMSTIRKIDNDYFEFDASLNMELEVGFQLVLRHVGNYRPCIHLLECENTNINNVNIYTNPGMGIVGHYSKNININNLKVLPFNNHLMSTTTDATHFINCEGIINFENCYFEGMGDDAINVHGFYNSITKIIDSHTLEVTILNENGTQDQIFDIPKTGDTVEFSKVFDLKPFANKNVIDDYVVDSMNWKAILKFKDPIDKKIKVGDLLTKDNDVAKLNFVNCHVKAIRARPCLIQTRNVLIDNCFFENCTGTAIHINTATFWWESVRCKNVKITNNLIKDCGYGDGTYLETCGIAILTESQGDAVGIHENIVIENNKIYGNFKTNAITVKNTDKCLIQNNLVQDCINAVVISSSDNIVVKNNDFGNQGISFKR